MHRLVMMAMAFVLTIPAAASACGGFFCSQVPVEQAGERILFAVEGTTVTAHIQIQYQGEAEKFSWVVPLPSEPVFGIGTDVLFQRLAQVTDPRFMIDWQQVEGCQSQMPCDYAMAGAGGDPSENPPPPSPGGVDVIAEGEVGPFEYKVVESESGDALFQWLNDNGYDQPEEAKPLVQHYANQGYKFVALKLQKGKAVGEMQPLVVTFDSPTLACVPLKLTSIAAAADMPVFTWVLAKSRAIPMNFFHVVLNAKAYPWLQCANGGGWGWGWGGNGGVDCAQAYMDLVTDAADAANGHAFVTEFAGPSDIMDKQVYQDGQFDLEKLKGITSVPQYLQELIMQGFPRDGLMQEVIKTAVPMPADLPEDCDSDQEFYSWNTEQCLTYMPEGWEFDPVAMTADLEERVVQPMIDAQALFTTHTYLTRLFTTVSPDEMTKDPMFSFNPDLPDVSNVHTVQATPVCKPGSTQASAVEITYPTGDKVTVPGSFTECGPFVADAGSEPTQNQPPAADIQVMSESGAAESVAAGDIDKREQEIEVRTPIPTQANIPQTSGLGDDDPQSGTFGTPASSPKSGSSGCSAAGTGAPMTGLLFGLVLLGLVVTRRRIA